MTLRAHLVVLVAAIALPLVVFASLMVFLFGQREHEATERALLDAVHGFTLAIDREIESSISTLQALGVSDHLEAGDIRDFYEEAKRVRAAHPAWPTVFLIDAGGQEIFSLLRPLGTPLPNVARDPDVVEAFRTGRPYVSDLMRGPVSGVSVVRVHNPVTTPAGTVKYVLSATLLPDHFTRLLTSQRISQDLTVLVLDRKGTTVARTGDSRSWLGRPAPSALLRRTGAQVEGVFTSTALTGHPSYVAFSRVPSAGFTVVVGVPFQAMQPSWLWIVIGGSAIALGAALLLALTMAERIGRPILALATRARALGRGDPVTDGARSVVDEVEVVRAAFVEAAAMARERAREHEERVAAEAARREAEAANRAKDRFLARVSHELRTPLTSMLAYIRILRTGKVPESHLARVLDTLERSTRLQARLVDDLLDVSRIAAGKLDSPKAQIDLRACVGDAVDACAADAGVKGVALNARLGGAPALVLGDAVRLQQVVGNLLCNAVKFTPAGGRVDVRVECEQGRGRIVVSDTGQGIAPDFLPHVFEPFRQADGAASHPSGGLGLGLAIVRDLVEEHGGTVRVASQGLGFGATFTVELPLLADRLDPSPTPDTAGVRA